MITLQHSLVTAVYLDSEEENRFGLEIPYVLIPDAIRAYIGERKGCHFEQNETKTETSWCQYPESLKTLTKEAACAQPSYIVPFRKCVLGEETNIEEFERRNSHLPNVYYYGVKKHLTQDYLFDKKIREWIDCTKMYDDQFIYKNQVYNGAEIRKKIAEIEYYGLYILSYIANQNKKIIANQNWFFENVKQPLDREYPQKLSESAYKYMVIPEKINDWITNQDWTHLNEGPISFQEYYNFYEEVGQAMKSIDYERKENSKLR